MNNFSNKHGKLRIENVKLRWQKQSDINDKKKNRDVSKFIF